MYNENDPYSNEINGNFGFDFSGNNMPYSSMSSRMSPSGMSPSMSSRMSPSGMSPSMPSGMYYGSYGSGTGTGAITSSNKSESGCGPDEEPGTLYGCKKKAKSCPGGAATNWYGGCDTCEYGKVKNFLGSCVDANPNGGGSSLSFIGLGGKKGKKSKKNSNKVMRRGKMFGGMRGGGYHGPANPYNQNIWTEPGQYPSAVGGRRSRKSKGRMTRKYKNKRTRKCKHKRNKKCSRKCNKK